MKVSMRMCLMWMDCRTMDIRLRPSMCRVGIMNQLGKGEGVITVDAGVSEVSISIEVEAKKKLSGKESATLTLTGGKGTTGESLEKGVSIKDDGCAPGDPQELTGEAACPDKDDPTKAVFAWTATLDPNYGDESEYAYVFDVDGLQDDGYTITSIDVSGRDYESTGKGEGVITVDAECLRYRFRLRWRRRKS